MQGQRISAPRGADWRTILNQMDSEVFGKLVSASAQLGAVSAVPTAARGSEAMAGHDEAVHALQPDLRVRRIAYRSLDSSSICLCVG